MIERFKNYIDNNSVKVIIDEKGIYIENYNNIDTFTNNIIKISNICIIGSELVITKLLDNCLRIEGNIYEVKLK